MRLIAFDTGRSVASDGDILREMASNALRIIDHLSKRDSASAPRADAGLADAAAAFARWPVLWPSADSHSDVPCKWPHCTVGMLDFNQEQRNHGEREVDLVSYLATPHFVEATTENWSRLNR